ncbi:MAG: hypothetical protein GDA38_13495 [Hormoscilla sp. SP12CHS1]|nr:hypothetical protein [Hormoscilla sp. SP12CHS1]
MAVLRYKRFKHNGHLGLGNLNVSQLTHSSSKYPNFRQRRRKSEMNPSPGSAKSTGGHSPTALMLHYLKYQRSRKTRYEQKTGLIEMGVYIQRNWLLPVGEQQN